MILQMCMYLPNEVKEEINTLQFRQVKIPKILVSLSVKLTNLQEVNTLSPRKVNVIKYT